MTLRPVLPSRRPSRHALLVSLALSASACGGSNIFTPPPTAPAPTRVTETFSGTINRNGAATYPFTVQHATDVSATLTAISPDGTAIGLSMGTWNGVACQIVIANDNLTLNLAVNGKTTAQGNLCIRVYDVGQLSGETSYTIEVDHE